jgi:two-component system sensor histidine kinase KdpD
MRPIDGGGLTAQEKLDRQTDLVNMMVHDLKGPLMEVMANIDLIQNSPDASEIDKECAETAMTGCNNLLETVSDMLDVGKIEANMLKPEIERLNLTQSVEDELKKIALSASDRKVKTAFNNEGPVFIRADKKLLGRVIANLLSNGLKFSPSGSVLRVFVSRKEKTGRFMVKDEGPGVPPAYRKVIFDKYTQVELRTHRVPGGTGLGLTFCKLAIEAQNGIIGVEDVPVGSEFYFEMPLDEQA